MADETNVATTPKRGRKPAASKSAKPVSRTRKTTAKSTTRKVKAKGPSRRAAEAPSMNRMQGAIKEVAFVQLGIAGRMYDELNARMGSARKNAPRQWDALVKRGVQVQRDFDKAGSQLRRDIGARVDASTVKARVEKRIAAVRKTVSKLRQRNRKAA